VRIKVKGQRATFGPVRVLRFVFPQEGEGGGRGILDFANGGYRRNPRIFSSFDSFEEKSSRDTHRFYLK